MTDGNIPKHLLSANEKMNRRTSSILFTLETGMPGRFKRYFAHGIYGLMYAASKPIRLQELYLQYYTCKYSTFCLL